MGDIFQGNKIRDVFEYQIVMVRKIETKINE